MKSKILVIFFSILTATICIIAFIPWRQQFRINIKAGYLNTYQQLYTPANWSNWLPKTRSLQSRSNICISFNQKQHVYQLKCLDKTFLIKQQGSNSLLITKATGHSKLNYALTIISDPLDITTIVVVTLKTSVLKCLLPFLADEDLELTDIINLKNYMEDTRLYYGFDIKTSFVPKMDILVNKKTVLQKNSISAGISMLFQLHSYISEKHIKTTGPVMVQYINSLNDSVKLMVGLPVDAFATANTNFQMMQIPATSILTANFKGPYSEREHIYRAFDKYVQDKFLHPKIPPIEVFEDGFPDNSNNADFNLIYPIF